MEFIYIIIMRRDKKYIIQGVGTNNKESRFLSWTLK